MIDFENCAYISTTEGELFQIHRNGVLLWQWDGLPLDEYKEVEWLRAEEDEEVYIDLGFAFDTKADIYLDFYYGYSSDAYISSGRLFGTIENSGNTRCCITCPHGGYIYAYGTASERTSSGYYFYYPTPLDLGKTLNAKSSIRFTIEPNKPLKLYNLSSGTSSTTEESDPGYITATYSMNSNLVLFAQMYNGTLRFGSRRTIGYFKYYDKNNNLICNLIPCYRKTDGEPGMFDIVRKIFFNK